MVEDLNLEGFKSVWVRHLSGGLNSTGGMVGLDGLGGSFQHNQIYDSPLFDNHSVCRDGRNRFLQCRRHWSHGQLKSLACTPTEAWEREGPTPVGWTLDKFAYVQDKWKRFGKRKEKPRSYVKTKLHSPEWLNQAVLKASIKNGGGKADSEKSEEQVTCTKLQV